MIHREEIIGPHRLILGDCREVLPTLGKVDAGGYVYVTGRAKDMFIVGGFNAYPAEIENLLMAYEGIAQVAVVGHCLRDAIELVASGKPARA